MVEPAFWAKSQADGVDGVIHSATRLALQLFLNSERAGQIDKASGWNSNWRMMGNDGKCID